MCVYYTILIPLVLIIDPTVKVELGYKPYDDGVDNGVFIKV